MRRIEQTDRWRSCSHNATRCHRRGGVQIKTNPGEDGCGAWSDAFLMTAVTAITNIEPPGSESLIMSITECLKYSRWQLLLKFKPPLHLFHVTDRFLSPLCSRSGLLVISWFFVFNQEMWLFMQGHISIGADHPWGQKTFFTSFSN